MERRRREPPLHKGAFGGYAAKLLDKLQFPHNINKERHFCRSFLHISLNTGQFLQHGSQIQLLPRTVGHTKVTKLSGGGVNGLTQAQPTDDAGGG